MSRAPGWYPVMWPEGYWVPVFFNGTAWASHDGTPIFPEERFYEIGPRIPMPDDPPAQPQGGKTVRVRACVAVTRGGLWRVAGTQGLRDDLTRRGITISDAAISWIEADVPLPQEEMIEGRVVSPKENDNAS